MQWCLINPEYLDFLKKTESRIPNYEYTQLRKDGTYKKLLKPFFAVVLKHNDFVYVAQVNHAQKRHYSIPESKDFIKIFDPVVPKKILCVVNLNYMFPVPASEIKYLKMKDIEEVRDFDSIEEKSNYIKLLNIEMKQMGEKDIPKKASDLYSYIQTNFDSKLKARCFDWDYLENQCSNWTQNQIIKSEEKSENLVNKEFYYDNKKYTVLAQASDKKYFAAIRSDNYESLIPKEINLFEINDKKIKNIRLLDEQIDICGIGNIDNIIEEEIVNHKQMLKDSQKSNLNFKNKSSKTMEM